MPLTQENLTPKEKKKYTMVKMHLRNAGATSEEEAAFAAKTITSISSGVPTSIIAVSVLILAYALISALFFSNTPWISFPLACAAIFFSVKKIIDDKSSMKRMVSVYANEETGKAS